MSTITPEDGAELLHASAHVREIRREENQREWMSRWRDLVLCMERQRLLVAMDGDSPLAVPGPDGKVLLAFTDDEAADAWLQARHPADAHSHHFAPNVDEAPGSERQGRDWWIQWMDRLGAVVVNVNPAGPLGFPVRRNDLRTARPHLRRRATPQTPDPWLDPQSRSAERHRVGSLLQQLSDAVEAGDHDEYDALAPHTQIRELNRMGSGMWVAEYQTLEGRWRLHNGDEMAGTYQMLHGAKSFGTFGDPYRAIDGLLEVSGILLDLRDRGASDPEIPDFPTRFATDAVTAMRAMRTGYREEEIDTAAERLSSAESAAGTG